MQDVVVAKLAEQAIDRALIIRAQQGDQRATDKLLERYEGMIAKIALRYSLPGYDRDDLMQLGRLGLLKAIERFNLDAGTCFSTLATRCITTPLHHAYKHANARIRGEVAKELSIDAAFDGEGKCQSLLDFLSCSSKSPETALLQTEEISWLLVEILKSVKNPYTHYIITSLAEGSTIPALAAELGINPNSLTSIIERIRKTARKIKARDADCDI